MGHSERGTTMREILFRGKRIDNGKWVYGDLRQYSETSTAIYSYAICRMLQVDYKTVGQYTGIADQEGLQIFEGDIIRAFAATGELVKTGFVRWDEYFSGWYVRSEGAEYDDSTLYGYNIQTYQLIGNIHD